MTVCRACEENKHSECEGFLRGQCGCECNYEADPDNHPDYATDEKLMWADLRRKERRER